MFWITYRIVVDNPVCFILMRLRTSIEIRNTIKIKETDNSLSIKLKYGKGET